jgi:hypothetical protein
MLRYRRWAAVGALAVAQIAIIVCYVGILRGNAVPAASAGARERASAPTKNEAPSVTASVVPPEPVLLAQGPPVPEPAPAPPAPVGAIALPPPPTISLGSDKEKSGQPLEVPPPPPLPGPPTVGEAKKDEAADGRAKPLTTNADTPTAVDPGPPPPPAAPAPGPGASLQKPTDPPAAPTPAPPGPAPVIDRPDTPPAPLPAPATEKKESPPAPAAPIAPPPLPDDKAPAIPPAPASPAVGTAPVAVPADTTSPPPPPPSSGEGRLVPMSAAPAPAPVETPPPVACPWILRMEIVKGRTQLEARIGKEVQFRVTCTQLSIEAPRGCLNAKGDVKITGSELDGSCEGLSINWQDDHVFLEGKAHLKCLRNGQDVDLNADRLSLKLSTSSSVKGVGSHKRAETEEPPTGADDADLK